MKAGYKKTEIGIIPGDWEVLPFRGILITNIKHGIYKNKDYAIFDSNSSKFKLLPKE